MHNLHILRYNDSLQKTWDTFVMRIRQASFLFLRSYLDYHRDRFCDCSLMVLDDRDHVVALLPANVSRSDSRCVESHGGLTYGGLLYDDKVGVADVGLLLDACLTYYRREGFSSLVYKPLPSIYDTVPAEEDRYWLFRFGATLTARASSSVIDLRSPLPLSTLRRRKVAKANRCADLQLCDSSERLGEFWNVLTDVLASRHHTCPVHTLEEITRLQTAHPDNIRLFTALADGKVLAGTLLYLTRNVVHAQYIAASELGRETGALDWLFACLIDHYKGEAIARPWFDFGISTASGGQVLNEGLAFQKEGFGARTICYDQYTLML